MHLKKKIEYVLTEIDGNKVYVKKRENKKN